MDIGGANIKIFHIADALCEYKQYYFPMWKKKNKFMSFLRQLTERANLNADAYIITMTAELCDCFKDRREGVTFILNALKEILDGKIFVFSNHPNQNLNLLDTDDAMRFPYSVASANFMATAKYISKFEKNAIIIDIGSTTTDIIPIKDGKILAHRTDFERLKNDELVYTGVLRTNLISISNKIKFKGKNLKISAEYFANTGDVYRSLGKISENEYTSETSDRKGKSTIECIRRIARTVCCDVSESEIYKIYDASERKSKISKEEVIQIAKYFMTEQIKTINRAIERLEKKYKIKNRLIIGAGKFLYKDLNASPKYGDLSAVKALYFLTKDLQI